MRLSNLSVHTAWPRVWPGSVYSPHSLYHLITKTKFASLVPLRLLGCWHPFLNRRILQWTELLHKSTFYLESLQWGQSLLALNTLDEDIWTRHVKLTKVDQTAGKRLQVTQHVWNLHCLVSGAVCAWFGDQSTLWRPITTRNSQVLCWSTMFPSLAISASQLYALILARFM